MKHLVATLPYPPSMNRAWRSGRGRVYLSKTSVEFRATVTALLCRSVKFGSSKVTVDVKMYPPDNRKRDIDNIIKPLLDALQAANIFDDDSQIVKLMVEKMSKREMGRVEIEVKELV